jgi:hypothetical protein
MASTSETYSENFNDNNSFKVDILSAPLSGTETEANTGLILTTYTTQTLRQVSLIYKYTRTAIKEEKVYTKKRYFCNYCPP